MIGHVISISEFYDVYKNGFFKVFTKMSAGELQELQIIKCKLITCF